MLDIITATTKDIVREAEVRFIHTDITNISICEETYNGINNTLLLIGRKYRFTYPRQSKGAVETAPERHLAVLWVHHSFIHSLLRNLRIVSGFL